MISFLETELEKKDKNLYLRFKIITKLLNLSIKETKVEITNKYLMKILNVYLTENKKNINSDNILDTLFIFFEEIIDSYLIGNFDKYNFILKDLKINENIKEFLKEKKEEVLQIIEYYLENPFSQIEEILVSNNYYDIIKIKGNLEKKKFKARLEVNSIMIRFMIKGKLFYEDGFILTDNYYIITGKESLKSFLPLEEELYLVVIILKKSLIEILNIKESFEKNAIRSLASKKHIDNLLNINFLKERPFYFIETLIYFLKSNNLLEKNITPLLKKIRHNTIDLADIFSKITKNIKLNSEKIKDILIKETELSNMQLDNFLVEKTNLTLKKLIIKLKIKYILEEYWNNNVPIEDLIEKYNIENMKIFRYNLKIFYNLSIKDLKKIKKKSS